MASAGRGFGTVIYSLCFLLRRPVCGGTAWTIGAWHRVCERLGTHNPSEVNHFGVNSPWCDRLPAPHPYTCRHICQQSPTSCSTLRPKVIHGLGRVEQAVRESAWGGRRGLETPFARAGSYFRALRSPFRLMVSHTVPTLPARSRSKTQPSDTWVRKGGASGSGISLGREERARDTLCASRKLFQSLT